MPPCPASPWATWVLGARGLPGAGGHSALRPGPCWLVQSKALLLQGHAFLFFRLLLWFCFVSYPVPSEMPVFSKQVCVGGHTQSDSPASSQVCFGLLLSGLVSALLTSCTRAHRDGGWRARGDRRALRGGDLGSLELNAFLRPMLSYWGTQTILAYTDSNRIFSTV